MGAKENIKFLTTKNIQGSSTSFSDIDIIEGIYQRNQYVFGRRNSNVTLIMASLHTEMQKFGKNRQNEQTSLLFAELTTEDKETAQKHNIDIIGIDLTIAQTKALFAVQKLLSFTQYQGNYAAEDIISEGFKYNGPVPRLKITVPQYLYAYGVSKNKTKRGRSEYNSNERTEALKALRDLNDNRYFITYARKYRDNKGNEILDTIKTVQPLIKITEEYEAMKRPAKENISSTDHSEVTIIKLKNLIIEPSAILIDQIQSYYLLKPANYIEEIKQLAPHASKYVYTFIDYLIVQAELHRRTLTGWILKVNYEELAYKLRMESWLKSRNWKQIRRSLEKCYETAIKLEYLISHETIQGVTKQLEKFVLNKEKFEKIWKIKEKRKQLRLPL